MTFILNDLDYLFTSPNEGVLGICCITFLCNICNRGSEAVTFVLWQATISPFH